MPRITVPHSLALAALAAGAILAGPAAGDERPARSAGLVSRIQVLPDKAPDCSSLRAIATSVTRGCSTNDQRAVAIYNFMQLAHYHHAYPGEPGGLPVLKEINAYGWSLCGGLHAEQSALWRELGWDWRFVGWNGHTTVEAKYDGKWHYLDVFLKFYAWKPDPAAPGGRTIASEDDLTRDSNGLIRQAFVMDPARKCVYAKDDRFARQGDAVNWRAPAFLTCGDTIDDLVSGLKTHRGADRSEGWNAINHATGSYSADVDLAPGQALTSTWDPLPDGWYWATMKRPPQHTCGGHKDTRNDPGIGLVLEPYVSARPARNYASGTFTVRPDFSSDAVLSSFQSVHNARRDGNRIVPDRAGEPAVLVLALAGPYPVARATGAAEGASKVEVSTDGGKSFRPADLQDLTPVLRGRTAALVRLTVPEALRSLSLEAVVQNNAGSLPFLAPGRNRVTVSVADPQALGDNRLVVTYAYRLGSRTRSFAQLCDEDKEIAKGHNATWDEAPTVVQKTFTARDLPATFDIDCPTPAGKHPVYPRMLFVRREVLTPGAKPLPLPENTVAYRPAATAELKELPSPFVTTAVRP